MALTQEKIKEINRKADEVLSTVFEGQEISLPIDLGAIADSYNLTLKLIKSPPPGVVGAYNRDEKTIYVSEGTPFKRLAFTIAHEMGHHFLHEEKTKEIYYRMNYLNLDKQNGDEETQANWFAASLLMPENLVQKYWEEHKNPSKLADIFGVSRMAMGFRLKNLNLHAE